MTCVVADANVTVKWMLPFEREAHTDKSLALLSEVRAKTIILRQPPHWLAEVAAVLTRLRPASVLDNIADIYELGFQVVNGRSVYLRACALARELDHHLFDTLYHAVALEVHDTVLLTADERYYQKAKTIGSIMLLSDFRVDRPNEQNPGR